MTGEVEVAGGRRHAKSASAFRTISEVAEDLDVPSHVLRFWETKFSQIRPLKRGGGRRYYRPEDVELLRRIRQLLYRDGYTIKGVQRLLRDRSIEAVEAEPAPAPASPPPPLPSPAKAQPGPALPKAAMPPRDLGAVADELAELKRLLMRARARG
ncbi:MAG: MerR family transcriptional regulator [Alphaproteobacteria bacterium]|nr:MerR family transcriptional regulator [Alphaproteobacteria bacterium]